MWPETIFKRRILVSCSHVKVDDFLLPSHTHRSMAMHAFADGFGSSLIGGLVYCLILVCYYPDELRLAGVRVLALCLTFGGIETWRVMRRRTLRDMKAGLLWALTANTVMWWALGTSLSLPPVAPPAHPGSFEEAGGVPRNG